MPSIQDLLMRLPTKRLLTCCLLLAIVPVALAEGQDDTVSEDVVTTETAEEPAGTGEVSDADAQAAAAASIAQKLSNPVASLISVPIQLNYDDKYGLNEKGSVWRTNVSPVIPISLNDNWNMISRTIVPIVKQSDVPIPGLSESGIGDIVQSVFFSPKKPTDNGLIWGIGPVINIPTSTKETLGPEAWAAGPTGLVLKQSGPWTYGALANHLWSFAKEDKTEINASFVQPFVSYITPKKLTYYVNTESTYNWDTKDWSVPINFGANQLMKVGNQIMQVGGGLRYWAESSEMGPKGWGVRVNIIFVFPT
ncbi:MAG: transporter [Luminiphilus sp.]|nr:transporter [Luminiphilus sp.]